MYRDQSLMPKEAARLAALGVLLAEGPMAYNDVAASVRHFIGRITGPSLDLAGSSLELLRLEGLIERDPADTDNDDNPVLFATDAGRAQFETLMASTLRAPTSDGFNKLVLALKLRFLALLDRERQIEQLEMIRDLYRSELARARELRAVSPAPRGYLARWVDHDSRQLEESLAWIEALAEEAKE